MSWFNVLKTPRKTSGRINTEVEFMLNTIFNIPPEILPTLNIPNNLVKVMRLERNLEAINEQQFDRLLQLGREGKYQELLDTLVVLLDATKRSTEEQKKYRADKEREYRKTPQHQKYIREYLQRPEVRERKRERSREYYQRPEVKERRNRLKRERYRAKKEKKE